MGSFAESLLLCWRSEIHFCLLPTSTNKRQKTTTTDKRSHAGGVYCTFVSSRLNIFRLRHLDANVLFILARLKHDNKQFLREKTSNVFLPLLLGFQLTTFHMIRPTVKGTHEMWESIRKIVPAVSLERLSGLRCSKT